MVIALAVFKYFFFLKWNAVFSTFTAVCHLICCNSLSLFSTFQTLGPIFWHTKIHIFWITEQILKVQTDLCSAKGVLSEDINIWLLGVFKKYGIATSTGATFQLSCLAIRNSLQPTKLLINATFQLSCLVIRNSLRPTKLLTYADIWKNGTVSRALARAYTDSQKKGNFNRKNVTMSIASDKHYTDSQKMGLFNQKNVTMSKASARHYALSKEGKFQMHTINSLSPSICFFTCM